MSSAHRIIRRPRNNTEKFWVGEFPDGQEVEKLGEKKKFKPPSRQHRVYYGPVVAQVCAMYGAFRTEYKVICSSIYYNVLFLPGCQDQDRQLAVVENSTEGVNAGNPGQVCRIKSMQR